MSDPYDRILIVGNAGSGKSTLATLIGKNLNLPVHHLDKHFWGPNCHLPEDEALRRRLTRFLNHHRWVIEGEINNMDLRVHASDLIIYLNRPWWQCMLEVLKCLIMYMITNKTLFMPADHPHRISKDFLMYVYTFDKTRGPVIEETLKKYSQSKKFITLTSNEDISDFKNTFLHNICESSEKKQSSQS